MDHKRIEFENCLLDIIFNKIISNIDSTDKIGLLDGKMGIVLFLYNYARLKKSKKAYEIADDLIDKIWDTIHREDMANYFNSGHSGIAWALSELGYKKFLDIDDSVNTYIMPIDFYITREQKTKIPVLIDMENGLFISGIYLLSRCSLPGLNLTENYIWREHAIYLIEDVERILYKKTSFNNVFLPEQTLSLLNSILYFLISVHKQKIYPHKTSILLKYVAKQIHDKIKTSNIAEVITSLCLLLTIREELYLDDKIVINESVFYSVEHEGSILDILAKSGFYTILYNNKLIFEKVYSKFINNSPESSSFLYDSLAKNDQIPIETILCIGHGLLALLEKTKYNEK